MNDKMSDLVDSLVVASLQFSYENNKFDYKLLDAIETVLEYYMPGYDFLEWARNSSVITEEME